MKRGFLVGVVVGWCLALWTVELQGFLESTRHEAGER